MTVPDPAAFEKLGALYLGRGIDTPDGDPDGPAVLVDSKDLTTHAVIVGMTGSGKTGLGICMIEEAAIDGVPVIAVDVKGDLTNLLLTFPGLADTDFRPWLDPAEAQRKGRSPDEMAAATASMWRDGLAAWGQDGSRIARFREAVDLRLYTPGAASIAPLSLLGRLDAPRGADRDDEDSLHERIEGTVSGLLALLGLDADPVRSREHILLSRILDDAWRAGRSLELADLIRAVQSPPFDTVGVVGVDAFFPPRERTDLAMMLNHLLASPGFRAWREGEPLHIPDLLHAPSGRPRLSILYLAHLSEAERMFFVTRLLSDLVAWMRTQPGTGSLRALLYMDEVFGYFPPSSNPPSKRPLLTLMKQARAFGVGVVLSTQNPVDLDYKGLSNAGTWMLGRLQTERDKLRVLDGLETASAAATLDRADADRLLSSLGKRRFLLHSVHEPEPTLFHTRWALSYLAGPLTIAQVRDLATTEVAEKPASAGPSPGATGGDPTPREAVSGPGTGRRPLVPPDLDEAFLKPVRFVEPSAQIGYAPCLAWEARMHYVKAPWAVDSWQHVGGIVDIPDLQWGDGEEFEPGTLDTSPEPVDGAHFEPVPTSLDASAQTQWRRDLQQYLYRERTLLLLRSEALGLVSGPGEDEGTFRARIRHAVHERRDREIESLRERYARKLDQLQRREKASEDRVTREEGLFDQQKIGAVLDAGATLLGALLGGRRRSSVGGATRTARRLGRAAQERSDVRMARENLEDVRAEIQDLNRMLEDEIAQISGTWDVNSVELEEVALTPRKADIRVERVALVWMPYAEGPDGRRAPLHRQG